MRLNNITKHIYFLFFSILFSIESFACNVLSVVPESIRTLPKDFKEKYKGDEFNYEESVSVTDRLFEAFLEFFIRLFSIESQQGNNDLRKKIEFVFYLLIIAFVGYLIAKLALNKEVRWLFGKQPEVNKGIDIEEIQNIDEKDFKKLIKESEAEKDYRSAIKYYYFFLLKKMDIAEKIRYDSQKTTHDYSLELEGTDSYKLFSKAAYYYTYIWYGEFEIDANEYQTASSSFVELLKQFNNE